MESYGVLIEMDAEILKPRGFR